MSSATAGDPVAAAVPTGPPPAPSGRSATASANGGGRPTAAPARSRTGPSAGSSSRWTQSRSCPRAAPAAETTSGRAADGWPRPSWSTRSRSRRSWRRAVLSTSAPAITASRSSECNSPGTGLATTRPRRRTATRSASPLTVSGSWVTTSTPTPRSRSPRTMSVTVRDSAMLSAAVGSSRMNSSGRPTSARATATSWRSPPERVATGRWRSASSMPRRPSSRRVSASRRASSSTAGSRPSQTLATTSRWSQRARSCQTMPTERRSPAISTVPDVGRSSPARHRMSVVFPAPFSPTTASTSPGRTSRSTPSSTARPPSQADSWRTLRSEPDVVSGTGSTLIYGPPGGRAGDRDRASTVAAARRTVPFSEKRAADGRLSRSMPLASEPRTSTPSDRRGGRAPAAEQAGPADDGGGQRGQQQVSASGGLVHGQESGGGQNPAGGSQ